MVVEDYVAATAVGGLVPELSTFVAGLAVTLLNQSLCDCF
jgi:hypothetical protein